MFQRCIKAPSLIIIVLLSILGLSYCQTNSSNSTETQALLDFKVANAANSTFVRGWTPGTDICKPRPWRGLTCWSTGLVRWLLLPKANLTGNISTALAGLRVLTRLDLRDNGIAGEIPPSLGTLVRLKRLLLSGNKLQGTLPGFIGNMTALEQLIVADNNLTGNIPDDFFAKFTSLWMVDLSNNHLTGPISDNLTNLVTLKVVQLGSNNLNGSLPSSLASSSSLQVVDLSGNSLTGSLPLNWTSSNLTFLNLSKNQLTGQVPLSLLNLPSLVNFSLAGNNLTGDIPTTASCRFGNLAFGGNPNLIIQPCPDPNQIDSVVPSPSPNGQVLVPGPAEGEASTKQGAASPGPQIQILSGDDSNGQRKSRLFLALVVVAANIGTIIFAAALISFLYIHCKKRGQEDLSKEDTLDRCNNSTVSNNQDDRSLDPTIGFSTTTGTGRSRSSRNSDSRVSTFSESPPSEFEKSAIFPVGAVRNDQPELIFFRPRSII